MIKVGRGDVMKADELLKSAVDEFSQIFQEVKEVRGIVKFNKIVDMLIETLTNNEAFWNEYFEYLIQEADTEPVKLHLLDIKQFIRGKLILIFKDAFPGNEDEFVMKFENKLYSIFASFLNRPVAFGRIYEINLKGIGNAT